jgi:hypothetical protein
MTDDELRAIVESTARATAANSDAISQNTSLIAELGAAGLRTEESLSRFAEHVDSWLEALRNATDDQADEHSSRTDQIETLFNNLRGEAIADRLEFRSQADADRQAFRDAIEADRARGDAERTENARRFDLLTAQADADRARGDAERAENARRFDLLTAQADVDRAEWKASFDAQQEVIQRLLLEIRSSNGEISQLSNRVNDLEQAS